MLNRLVVRLISDGIYLLGGVNLCEDKVGDNKAAALCVDSTTLVIPLSKLD